MITDEALEKGAFLFKMIWKTLPEFIMEVDINETLLLVKVVAPNNN
jgi:hypothetical protein